MPRIAVLSGAVADQIAAGEVVERPASVVKELVENALDAGASSVEISATDGGRASIRVSDDGVGMDGADAVLALERHATSKIVSAHDLVGVATFGFRGEALPAISSVSTFEIETAAADGEGTRVRAADGAILDVTPTARRRGTTVLVSRLFQNVPARRKFLRGARSEWRALSEAVTTLALVRRDIRLTLEHDGRRVHMLPPASSLRARIASLWGGPYAERLLDVEDVSGPIHVSGLAERPADAGTATRRIFLSVNGRAVRDPGLVRAAETAYRSTIPAGVRPTLLLDIVVPHDDVDVNVHPAKAEVRFRDRWPVERAVESAVRRALGTPASAAAFGVRAWPATLPAPEGDAVDIEVLRPADRAPGALFAGSLEGATATAVALAAHDLAPRPAVASTPEPVIAAPPLLQLRSTYLMFEHEDGLVLIDQHSAHERVLYEQFMGVLQRGEAPSQRLLFPLTLHLGPEESDAFEANRTIFEKLGFEIEGFGGHTLLVSAVPMPHPRFDAERCLRETLHAFSGDRVAGTAARHERLAATIACKAAIKAGDDLSQGEMRALFLALGQTILPAHDVHGRSTIVHLSWAELERRFGRQ